MMDVFQRIFLLLASCLIFFHAASAMSAYERMMQKKADKSQPGLYGPEDSVIILTASNFNSTLFNQPQATFAEFYNSYCGACQRFAPTWKATAKSIEPWKRIVNCAAIDCASDENNDICRKNEIMRYPTMRYYPPQYPWGENQLGVNLDHLLLPDLTALVNELTTHLVNETKGGDNWPKFRRFDGKQWSQVFEGIPASVKFAYIVTDTLPDFLPEQVVLDHMENDKIKVKILNSANTKLITDPLFRLGVVTRDGGFTALSIYNQSRGAFADSINEHLARNHMLASTSTTLPPPDEPEPENSTDSADVLLDRFFYDKARSLKPIPLFRADLEQAIRKTLGHEVVQHEIIKGESLAALRSFVSVLARYYDFGNRASYKKLLDYLMQPSLTELRGNDLQTFIYKLNPPIVRKSRYIGCFSTQRGLRRFPCSLWTLFHHLTVQHLDSEDNDDPMEVLHAMHGYVKHFFGCTDCSKHFQEMAKRNHIWNVTSKDQAALWLWSAHNEVNQRFSGDLTEDKNHPKIQFPADDHCHVCYKKTGEFDKTEVIAFLKRHYGNDHVNDMGMENLPGAMMLNARARQIFSAGANSHLHIGILAYVVIIICLMAAALKFYFRRGYRKKLYTHDILGKV